MTITADDFRTNFPEFNDTSKFTDGQAKFWIGMAYKMLSSDVWGDQLDFGVQLYVAHNLTLAGKNAVGGPGSTSGPLSSKGVGPVSVSYDVSAGTIQGAASYNMTTYGIQFYQLASLFGAGGIQLYGDGNGI